MVTKETNIEDNMEEEGSQPAIADVVEDILYTLVSDVVKDDN